MIKATISVIKALITGTKALLSALFAFGWIGVIIVLVICLIGLLCSSDFGIFFSNEDTGSNVKMNEYIIELNNEMDKRIKVIEDNTPHNEVIIDSNKADWKDILSIYAIKVSMDNKDVVTMDEEKKKILKETFWDMNFITYEVIREEHENTFFDSIDNNNFDFNIDFKNEINVLHINIESKSINDMILKYEFDDEQIERLNELQSEEYLSLWNNIIYGTFKSSDDITEWKQRGKEWSNIQLGNTQYTIDNFGCLATSIAILIKKSEVHTDNISPFNPGTFVIALNNNNGFDSKGKVRYSTISKIIPDFVYQGSISLNGKSKEEKFNEIKQYYEEGYYLTVEVMGATPNSQHWVAVDNISNNTILMIDPISKETNMWEKYDWNKTSRFIYFKAKK